MTELRDGEEGAVREALTVLPTFLVVGAQKSATTSLAVYLGGHPEVFTARHEVHFFDRHLDRGLDWYGKQFEGSGSARAIGESTPEYMYLAEVPPAMVRYVPEARLIAILRNPVDRGYSHYWHNRTRGWEPLEFEHALAAEPERLAAAEGPRRGRYAYLDRGRYLRQLQRIREYYPAEALRVVLLEDLTRDRVATVRALYRFLGVDDTVVPPTIRATKNRHVRFRSMRLRGPIRRLPPPLRRLAVRLNTRHVRYPPMPEGIRQRLLEEFAEGNEALAAWLGRDLGAWSA